MLTVQPLRCGGVRSAVLTAAALESTALPSGLATVSGLAMLAEQGLRRLVGSPDACAELSEVSLEIDGRVVIDGVSATLPERRIGVVGRNGSGKSTLARLVCGLIKPTAGTVTVGGVDVARDRKAAIRTVGLVFQNPDRQIIFPTVEEEVAFGLSQQGLPKDEAGSSARGVLARFGREGWAERPVHGLSQGQRHLVCILSVIAMEPALVVLDEPFTGPDLPTTKRLHRFLESLDVSQMLITHDTVALEGFERVIWLEQGRIHRDGPPGEVLGEYREEMNRLGDIDDFSGVAG